MSHAMRTKPKSPPLQPGAKLLPKVARVKIASWNPLAVDAILKACGVTWFRVYGGFSGLFDREDWIADLPGISVSVSDYHWNGNDFGPSYGSFENSCRQQLLEGLRYARARKAEAEQELALLTSAISKLEGCRLEIS